MSLSLDSQNPANEQGNVSLTSSIFIALHSSSSYLQYLLVTVDGDDAYLFEIGESDTTNRAFYPTFTGNCVVNYNYAALSVKARRASLPGQKHEVVVSARDGDGDEYHHTFSYYTVAAPSSLLDPEFLESRVDKPFTSTPALNAFRQAAKSSLRGRASASLLVQLYYRVYFSELRAYIPAFKLSSQLTSQLDRLVPQDVSSILDADQAFQALEILWDAALTEVVSMGTLSDSLEPLRKAYRSPYPQERVAAACSLVLLAAHLYSMLESQPTTL